MKTIELMGSTFVVREEVAKDIMSLDSSSFTNMQELIREFFDMLSDVYSDEYALAMAVYFKDSKAWNAKSRQTRCSIDVRKYNESTFKCMEGVVVDHRVRHLDGGTRATKRDVAASKNALAEIADQLS